VLYANEITVSFSVALLSCLEVPLHMKKRSWHIAVALSFVHHENCAVTSYICAHRNAENLKMFWDDFWALSSSGCEYIDHGIVSLV
jgi:hypothetical protein